MGEEGQLRYVAVRPDGTISGPIGEEFAQAKLALQVGHRRAGGSGDWEEIQALGYSVRLARIILLEE
jgi:hypothetical protein